MEWKCKICNFSCDRRVRLLRHYRFSHPHQGRHLSFPCLYKDCLVMSKSLGGLKAHMTKNHKTVTLTASHKTSEITYKCSVCHHRVENLFSHLNRHLKVFEKIQCPFKECFFETNVPTSYSSHKSRLHRNDSTNQLKDECLFRDDTLSIVGSDTFSSDQIIEDTEDLNEDMIVDHDSDTDEVFTKRIALFMLKLESVFHVPVSTIQQIVDELVEMHFLSRPIIQSQLSKVFMQQQNIMQDIMQAVTDVVMTEAPMIARLQRGNKYGVLSTHKLRRKFFQLNFPVVNAKEFILGKVNGKTCTMVYISVPTMIQKLLQRTDVMDKVLLNEETSQKYCSFKDGSVYKTNPFFENGDFRLAIGLYMDEFEVCNPLGTSKKKHKILAVYWVLADIPAKFRSQLHVIQLAALVKSIHVKEFGFEKSLLQLWQDLSFIENEGVFIESLGENLKGTVVYVSSDNLGAHQFGGFMESFGPNVLRPCRACMATNSDIQDVHFQLDKCVKRNKENFSYHIQQVEDDASVSKVYGVKRDCVLHKYLQGFHATNGLPFDVSHDCLEGIVPYEMALCLAYFIGRKYFTLDCLNARIRHFQYKFTDKVNQPQIIGTNFRSKNTIGGNQSENWTLIRLLPLLVGEHVPQNDMVWDVLLSLKDIVELVHSPVFTEEMITSLDAKIHDHKHQFTKAFPGKALKPKHHFIEHYTEEIKMFGPLVKVSTIRFEAKHNFFKRIVRNVNNFKNILVSLSTRHQLMAAYYLASPYYFGQSVVVENMTGLNVSLLSENIVTAIPSEIMSSSTVSVTDTIKFEGTDYGLLRN
ncbi:uncharacterized protein [Apostichopus japonicus]|uniref:uncharacterized protein isoform X1 n=1 Tax=Stichopus japonicus TaxID=307972 RepID=UPI003AB16CB8